MPTGSDGGPACTSGRAGARPCRKRRNARARLGRRCSDCEQAASDDSVPWGSLMWITLLIAHGLAAFMLLGAVTHQALGIWLPARSKAPTFVNRLRAVPPTSYVNAIVVLFLAT